MIPTEAMILLCVFMSIVSFTPPIECAIAKPRPRFHYCRRFNTNSRLRCERGRHSASVVLIKVRLNPSRDIDYNNGYVVELLGSGRPFRDRLHQLPCDTLRAHPGSDRSATGN